MALGLSLASEPTPAKKSAAFTCGHEATFLEKRTLRLMVRPQFSIVLDQSVWNP